MLNIFFYQQMKMKGGFMALAEYFEKAKGVGVLSTADQNGRVNAVLPSKRRADN
jgi:hypothetical protein